MMQGIKKVIWSEGAFLGQQHLQAWDSYHLNHIKKRDIYFHSFGFGFQQIMIDETLLKQGEYRLLKCEGVFKEGCLFDYDSRYSEPLQIPLAEHEGIIELFLGVPIYEGAHGINGYPITTGLAKWHTNYQNVVDVYDPSREQEVLIGELNLRLIVGRCGLEQFHYLKLAEVIREGPNAYSLSDNFVPSLLSLNVSESLRSILSAIIFKLDDKRKMLNETLSSSFVKSTYQDAERFQLAMQLCEINRELPILEHYCEIGAHPEKIYQSLLRICGGLDRLDGKAVAYDHYNLITVFKMLDSKIARSLEDVSIRDSVSLSFEREGEMLFHLKDINSQLFKTSQFYLGIFFVSEDVLWVDTVLTQLKIGACKDIDSFVSSGLSGVTVNWVKQIPSRLKVKPGFEYFHIKGIGPHWESIKENRSLSIFLPHLLRAAQLELITIEG